MENLSDCDDTNLMVKALNSNDRDFNVGAAGTTMRFLTAFLSLEGGGRMDDYGNRTHEEPSDQGVGGCAERFRCPDRVHGEGGVILFAYFRKRLARRRDLATGKC